MPHDNRTVDPTSTGETAGDELTAPGVRVSEREVRVLEVMATSSQPIGAPQVALQLVGLGVDLGEATVGRLLLNLEAKGLLRKAGRRGRTVTAAGLERLTVLQRRHAQIAQGVEIAYLLENADREALLDVLVARRAIEGETAALAALRANPADVAYLEELLTQSKGKLHTGSYSGSDSANFHLGIAKVARNHILEKALQMIMRSPGLFSAFVYARRQASGPLLASHQGVLDAIRKGNAELARSRMVAHIETVLVDVQRYWGNHRDSTGGVMR